MIFDGPGPLPLLPDIPPASPVEVWLSMFVLFWISFGLVLLILPANWRDVVIQAAFPFLSKRLERDDD